MRTSDAAENIFTPLEEESQSRNSLCLFQDALKNISPPPIEPDLADAIKTVLKIID